MVQGDGDYYTDDGKALQLKGTEVSFALSFVVPDFLSGEDIEYSYQLEGYDKDWTSFSSINEASYTGVPAGDYIFKVRYKRDVFDTEYRHFSIPVYPFSLVSIGGGLFCLFDHFFVVVRVRDIFAT